MLQSRGVEDWEDWLHLAVIDWLESGRTEHPCLKAWLVRVALNKRTDDYRSLRSRKTQKSIDIGHCEELVAKDDGIKESRSIEVTEVLKECTARQAEALTLLIRCGTASTAAPSLGVSRAAISSAVDKARRRIRKKIDLLPPDAGADGNPSGRD